jgi:hypothetical protein
LERVAEELMGRRRWRQYQGHILGASAISKLETQTAWEKRSKEEIVKEETEEVAEALDLPKDWQPEDRCYFCDGAVHAEPCRVSLVNPALCVALCVDHKSADPPTPLVYCTLERTLPTPKPGSPLPSSLELI